VLFQLLVLHLLLYSLSSFLGKIISIIIDLAFVKLLLLMPYLSV